MCVSYDVLCEIVAPLGLLRTFGMKPQRQDRGPAEKRTDELEIRHSKENREPLLRTARDLWIKGSG
jgi:hypothetical protein